MSFHVGISTLPCGWICCDTVLIRVRVGCSDMLIWTTSNLINFLRNPTCLVLKQYPWSSLLAIMSQQSWISTTHAGCILPDISPHPVAFSATYISTELATFYKSYLRHLQFIIRLNTTWAILRYVTSEWGSFLEISRREATYLLPLFVLPDETIWHFGNPVFTSPGMSRSSGAI